MDNRNTIPALAIQFSVGAIFCTLYYLLVLHTPQQPGLYFPHVWMVYGPLIYGINRLILRKERTALFLFLVNLFFCISLFLSILIEKGWNGFLSAGSILFVGGMLTVRGSQLAMEPPTLSLTMLHMDAGAAVLLLFAVYLSASQSSLFWGIPIILGFVATMLALITIRLDRNLGPKEWGVVTVAFAGLSLLVWLLVSVVAAPAGQGLVMLWKTMVALCKLLLRVLWAILLFVSSLFGEPEYGELEQPAEIVIPVMQEMSEEANPAMLVILILLSLAVLICLAVMGLRMLSRIRVGGRKNVVSEKRQHKKLSLLAGLKRLLAGIAKQVRLRLYLHRNRNRPVGLYYHLVRRCRRSPWRKRTGETPGMFLRRMRDSAGEDAELEAALEALIPAVDAALYAPGCRDASFERAALIRQRIGSAVRRHFVRQMTSELRSVVHRNGEAARQPES